MENPDALYWNIKLPNEVLRIIFDNLSFKDLANVAMVCRSWLEAANEEKRARREPCCFKFNNNVTLHEFSSFLKNIRIKPSIYICFSSDINNIYEKDIAAVLPKHCKAITLYNHYNFLYFKKEMLHFNLPNQGCVFLPEIPYVKIKLFKLPDVLHDHVIQETAEYQDIICTINNHETSMPNHETSTCLMLFSNCYNKGKYWASAIQESQENKIVSVLGGVCRAIYSKLIGKLYKKKYQWHFCPRVEYSLGIAILITGLIQTYSIVLEKECTTEEQIQAELQLFKNEVKLKRHSIVFMFESISSVPELYLYDEKAMLKLEIFRKLFPTVLIAGCVGNDGIFGKTTNIRTKNEEKNSEEEHINKSSESWYKIMSTVFLILTYE